MSRTPSSLICGKGTNFVKYILRYSQQVTTWIGIHQDIPWHVQSVVCCAHCIKSNAFRVSSNFQPCRYGDSVIGDHRSTFRLWYTNTENRRTVLLSTFFGQVRRSLFNFPIFSDGTVLQVLHLCFHRVTFSGILSNKVHLFLTKITLCSSRIRLIFQMFMRTMTSILQSVGFVVSHVLALVRFESISKKYIDPC